jgi:hypothetical protein
MSHKYIAKVGWYIFGQLSSLIEKIASTNLFLKNKIDKTDPGFVNYLRDTTIAERVDI